MYVVVLLSRTLSHILILFGRGEEEEEGQQKSLGHSLLNVPSSRVIDVPRPSFVARRSPPARPDEGFVTHEHRRIVWTSHVWEGTGLSQFI